MEACSKYMSHFFLFFLSFTVYQSSQKPFGHPQANAKQKGGGEYVGCCVRPSHDNSKRYRFIIFVDLRHLHNGCRRDEAKGDLIEQEAHDYIGHPNFCTNSITQPCLSILIRWQERRNHEDDACCNAIAESLDLRAPNRARRIKALCSLVRSCS